MRATAVAALGLGILLGIGCKDRSDGDPAPTPQRPVVDVLEGSLAIDGTRVKLAACKPEAGVHIAMVVITDRGALRYEDALLSWRDAPASEATPLTCKRLDRSWGGGRRPSGAAYWRGTLDFECTGGERSFVGTLQLDCGGITPTERAQLDRNRTQLRDEQRASDAAVD